MSSWKRKLLAAHNPGACALFFDLIITKFIEIVLRYKSSDGPGLFGTCDAYFATVEAQGKGTLHCHMLVWLNGHLLPQELRDTMTNSEEYKNRVFQWLESSIKCEFPYSEASPTIQSDRAERVLHKDTGNPHPAVIAAPRIPEKEDEMNDFWIHFKEYVNLLLYEYNWHEHQPTCWKYLKRGQEKIDANCRMGMNGETRPSTSLDPATASILLRRLHPKIASHSDVATFILQCNTDLKFVGSGEAAKSFLYYVTDYITKSSLQVHVGMAALSYAIKKIYSKTPDVLASGSENQTCGAVITAVNAMMGRHEISQPQVMSYLIGGGDHYTSEVFTVINWGLISGAVRAFWADVEDNMAESYRPEPMVNVQSDAQARITVSNQLLDYQFRSVNPNFNDLNLYNFGAYTKKVSHTSGVDISTRSGCFNGRGHPQQHSHLLSIRSVEHVPVLLGPSFANPSTSEDAREKWSRDMLILFKPWRNPDELKTRDATWCQAFDAYQHNFSPRSQKIIKNMTVLTECSDARHIRPHAEQANDPEANLNTDHENAEADDTTEHMTLYPDDLDPYTFRIFTVASTNLDPSTDHADQRDKHLIQKIGPEVTQLLNMCLVEWPRDDEMEPPVDMSSLCAPQDSGIIDVHRADMREKKAKKKRLRDPSDEPVTGRENRRRLEVTERITSPIAERLTLPSQSNSSYLEFATQTKEFIIDQMNLRGNKEQLRAFNIVADHVINKCSDQLLMHVSGVGGTGKSHVIKALVVLFERLKRRDQLVLGAPTGIAAVLIGGQTLHSLGQISPQHKSGKLAPLTLIWNGVKYLVMDEVSMVGCRFLSQFSERVRQGKGDDPLNCNKPFGGVNVIAFGDLAQLKPPKQYALFSYEMVKNPSFAQSKDNSGISAMNGALLWRQVTRVVELVKNQRHSDDPQYAKFLDRLRVRECKKGSILEASDYDYLCTRTLDRLVKDPVTMSSFRDAPIIVGSKDLRDRLNARLIAYHAGEKNTIPFLYHSRDLVRSSRVPHDIQHLLWDIPSSINHDALGRLPLFIGMKVMITENLAFANGIVNGTEGIVWGIKYSEESGKRFAEVVYVLVEGCRIQFEGLPVDVVAIFPVSKGIPYVWLQTTSLGAKQFSCLQLPLLPSYAYTDFKSQGRTLTKVIVDLATARGQGIYVMLSRVKSLQGLAILRYFPANKIFERISSELRDELCRLSQLARETSEGEEAN